MQLEDTEKGLDSLWSFAQIAPGLRKASSQVVLIRHEKFKTSRFMKSRANVQQLSTRRIVLFSETEKALFQLNWFFCIWTGDG